MERGLDLHRLASQSPVLAEARTERAAAERNQQTRRSEYVGRWVAIVRNIVADCDDKRVTSLVVVRV